MLFFIQNNPFIYQYSSIELKDFRLDCIIVIEQ